MPDPRSQHPRTPPGRAGRLWLRGRLDVARRGRDLLDRKLRLLLREQERLALLTERTGEDWRRACDKAEGWLLRAALLAGRRGLLLAGDDPPLQVTVGWDHTMGISYPAEVTFAQPPDGVPPLLPRTAALDHARTAHRAALAAAARHAAAGAAERTVGEELAATRKRLRAVEDRWIPRLEAALAQVELTLDELERADAARLRRARTAGAVATRRRPS